MQIFVAMINLLPMAKNANLLNSINRPTIKIKFWYEISFNL